MTEANDATGTFHLHITGIAEGRWHDLADLYAEDVVVDQPFMVPEPLRILGREQVRARFASAATGPLRLRPRDIVVHRTGDRAGTLDAVDGADAADAYPG